MYVRALIVVLAILNAGVALWWALRPEPLPPAPPAAPAGVASLQLIPAPAAGEATVAGPAAQPAVAGSATAAAKPAAQAAAGTAPAATATAAASAPAPANAAASAAPAPSARCLSFGPYPTREGAEATLTVAGTLLADARVREVAAGDATSFRVMMPAVGDRAAAQALVARIKAAGLGDYYVISQGERNDVALGQYRSREGAERRQSELAAKGFSADVLPSGGSGAARWWVDARTSAGDAQLRALRAPGQRSRDCATLR